MGGTTCYQQYRLAITSLSPTTGIHSYLFLRQGMNCVPSVVDWKSDMVENLAILLTLVLPEHGHFIICEVSAVKVVMIQ